MWNRPVITGNLSSHRTSWLWCILSILAFLTPGIGLSQGTWKYCDRPMFFTGQPAGGTTNCPGDNVVVTVQYGVSWDVYTDINGSRIGAYHLGTPVWQFNGTNLPASWSTNYILPDTINPTPDVFGTSNNSNYLAIAQLAISNVTLTAGGTYRLLITNQPCAGAGWVAVPVSVGPTVLQIPNTLTGAFGQAVSIAAVVGGVAPIQCQWRLRGQPLADGPGISGSATPTLTISSMGYAYEGYYDLVVSNACGVNTSTPVLLTISPVPQWTLATTNGPGSRSSPMVYDEKRKVMVLFGGASSPGDARGLGDTWEYNGTNWTQRATTGPPIRRDHMLAYDRLRGRTVLFGGGSALPGGYCATAYNDTWEWDGTTWVQTATNNSPGVLIQVANCFYTVYPSAPARRTSAAFAYESSAQKCVLVGGSGGFTDTWEYDGASQTWTMAATNGVNFSLVTLVYDSVRQKRVVFALARTGLLQPYEWDSGSGAWTTNNVPNLGAPYYYASSGYAAGMADYDLLHQETVYHPAIQYGIGPGTETWSYDGIRWRERLNDGPPPRSNAGFAYDINRQAHVLFGGFNNSGPQDPYTWELGYAAQSNSLSVLPPIVNTISNVSFVISNIVATTSNLVGTVSLILPAGLGVGAGLPSRIGSNFVSFANVPLDANTNPVQPSFTVSGPLAVFDEELPVWFFAPSLTWQVASGQITFSPQSAAFVRQSEDDDLSLLQSSLANPDSANRISNDGYFRSVVNNSGVVVVTADTNGVGQLTASLNLAPPELRPHLPYSGSTAGAQMLTGGGQLNLNAGQVSASSYLQVSQTVPVSYDPNCAEVDCSAAQAPPQLLAFAPDAQQFAFTADLGLLGAGAVSSNWLSWGYVSGANYAQSAGAIGRATYEMAGTSLAGASSPVAISEPAAVLLLTGWGSSSDPGYVERPGQSNYSVGAANYPGLNFAGLSSGSSYIANTPVGPYSLGPAQPLWV